MMPFQQPFPTSVASGPKIGGAASSGRPKKIGKFTVLRQPEQDSGFEFSKDTNNPEMLKQAQDLYFGGGKNSGLPSGLTPKRLTMAGGMEQRRRQSISKGWRNPRGAA